MDKSIPYNKTSYKTVGAFSQSPVPICCNERNEKMLQSIFTVEENVKIAKDVMKMTLTGDCSDITVPGQFVNLKIEGRYLRRPISV